MQIRISLKAVTVLYSFWVTLITVSSMLGIKKNLLNWIQDVLSVLWVFGLILTQFLIVWAEETRPMKNTEHIVQFIFSTDDGINNNNKSKWSVVTTLCQKKNRGKVPNYSLWLWMQQLFGEWSGSFFSLATVLGYLNLQGEYRLILTECLVAARQHIWWTLFRVILSAVLWDVPSLPYFPSDNS